MLKLYGILITSQLLLGIEAQSQTVEWYYVTTGLNGSGWSYVDVYIPYAMKIDSVYGGFQRPGVPQNSEDFSCAFEPGTSYTGLQAVSPWNYNDSSASLYNHWINLTSFNFIGQGVFRAAIPNGGNPATLDSLGIATSSTVGISSFEVDHSVQLYPNPSSDNIFVKISGSDGYVVYDMLGNSMMQGRVDNLTTINLAQLETGVYFIQVGQRRKMKFVKQ